jgi:hypothetical protein
VLACRRWWRVGGVREGLFKSILLGEVRCCRCCAGQHLRHFLDVYRSSGREIFDPKAKENSAQGSTLGFTHNCLREAVASAIASMEIILQTPPRTRLEIATA